MILIPKYSLHIVPTYHNKILLFLSASGVSPTTGNLFYYDTSLLYTDNEFDYYYYLFIYIYFLLSVFSLVNIRQHFFDLTGPKVKTICEFTTGFISCPTHTVLSVTSAKYGRTSSSICGQISVTNCIVDVASKVQSMCNGKSYCTLRPTNALFGNDPCPTVSKYLQVNFVCKKGIVRHDIICNIIQERWYSLSVILHGLNT